MSRRVSVIPLLFVVAFAVSVAVSGCVRPTPTATPSPSASEAPLFATEEEALAAATEAYGRYLEVSDAVGASGGELVDDLKPLVTDRYFVDQQAAFATLKETNRHTAGESKFQTPRIQSIVGETVLAYICLDVSGVQVIDSVGRDVTPQGRTDLLPLVVSLDGPELLVDASESWGGDSFCTDP